MKLTKALLLATTLVLPLANGAIAETYRSTRYQPDTETSVVNMKWFSEELAKLTNGAIQFEVFAGGVLAPAKATLQSVGDGVVQEGFHTSGLTPSELPLSNALAGSGFIERNPTAVAAAFADWVMHDPAGYKEYTQHNVVPLGAFSTPEYGIHCNTPEPITTLEQLKGLKVRWPGGMSSKLTQDLGGVPVNIPAVEIYQALQNGQIDCAGILAVWLNIDNKLEEVTNSSTLLGWEGSFNSPVHLFNADFWKGLTTEQRKIVMDLAARSQARIQINFNTMNQKAYDNAVANGHIVVEPDETITKAVEAWVAAGIGGRTEVAKSAYGVQDPDALYASFEPYLKKWGELVRGMKDPTSEDELTQLLLDNMYNDLDPATYGME